MFDSSVFGSVRSMDARSLGGPVIDVDVRAGTELVHQGAEIGTFFVIRSGTANVIRGRRTVATLGPGDCFGEIDPLAPSAQRYTVSATTSMRLVTFSAHGISRLCEAIPGTRERILGSVLPRPRALPQSLRVKDRDGPVIRRHPAKLAH